MRIPVLATLFWSLVAFPIAAAQKDASLVITNANIYLHPNANSLAILNGEIIAIDTDEKVSPFVSEATEFIDADGAFLMPGFIDNHNHVFEAASELGGSCELSLRQHWRSSFRY